MIYQRDYLGSFRLVVYDGGSNARATRVELEKPFSAFPLNVYKSLEETKRGIEDDTRMKIPSRLRVKLIRFVKLSQSP